MYIYTRVYNDMGMRGRLWDYGSVSLSDATRGWTTRTRGYASAAASSGLA